MIVTLTPAIVFFTIIEIGEDRVRYIKPQVIEEKIIETRLLFTCYLNDEMCDAEGGMYNTASEGQ